MQSTSYLVLAILCVVAVFAVYLPVIPRVSTYSPYPALNDYVVAAVVALASFAFPILVFHYRLRRSGETLSSAMEKLAAKSKIVELPDVWVKETLQLTYIGIPLALVLGAVLYVGFGNTVYAFIVAVLSLGTYFVPYIRAFDIRNTLNQEVTRELPVVVIVMWGLSQVGYSVQRMIETLSTETDISTAIAREFRKIYRDFTAFRVDPEDAIAAEAADHPSKIFDRLLTGILGISRLGGELSAYLERMAFEVITDLKEQWARFGRAASDMGELSILFMLVLPILAIFFALVEADPVYGVDLIAFFMVPVVGFALYMYVAVQANLSQLRVRGRTGYGIIGIAVGAVIDALFYIFTGYHPLWLLFEFPVILGSLGYGYPAHRAIRQKEDADNHLPLFSRTVAEHIRSTGDNLSNALMKLRGSRAFGKEINRIISEFLGRQRVVQNYRDAIPETHSWMTRSVFTTMQEMDHEGVLNYRVLTKITEMSDAFYDAEKTRRNGLLVFKSISFIAPALLAPIIGILFWVLYDLSSVAAIPSPASFGNTLGYVNGLNGFISFFNAFQNISGIIKEIVPALELMVAEVGVIFGLLYAKAGDGTLRNTFRVFQVSVVASIAIIALEIYIRYVLL
jgi:Flp pilus assembly protein TadB